MKVKSVVFASLLIFASHPTFAAAPELFRPAPVETVATFQRFAQVLVSDDDSGASFARSHGGLRRFAELDFERGAAALVLGSLSLSPDLVARVAEIGAISNPNELHRRLYELEPALREARRQAFRGGLHGVSVKDRVADWVRRNPPSANDVETGGFSSALLKRADQLDALSRFYGLDVQHSYIQFMAQAQALRRAKEESLLADAEAEAEDAQQSASEGLPTALRDAVSSEAPDFPSRLQTLTFPDRVSETIAPLSVSVSPIGSRAFFSSETIGGRLGLRKELPNGQTLFLFTQPGEGDKVRLKIFEGKQLRRDTLLDADTLTRDPVAREDAKALLAELRQAPAGALSREIGDGLVSALRDSSALHSLLPGILLMLLVGSFFLWVAISSHGWVQSLEMEIARDLKEAIDP